MLPTKILKSVVQFLHSNISPKEIAFGFALGAIIGLIPYFTLISFFVFFLIIILNVNFSAAMFSLALFKIIGFITDPIAHKIGYFLLVKVKFLENFWTTLYNMPIVPFTRFYNTVVLGSFIISIILFLPIVIFVEKFIIFYRKNLAQKVERLKIIKLLKLTSLYEWYNKLK
jgi:uncharacterized protein (TIGR03546 family)